MSKLTVSPNFSLTFFSFAPAAGLECPTTFLAASGLLFLFPPLPPAVFFSFPSFFSIREIVKSISVSPLLRRSRGGKLLPRQKRQFSFSSSFSLVGGRGGNGRSVVQRKLSNYRKRQFPGRVFSLFRKLIKTIFLLSAFPGGGGRAGIVEIEYYCFFNSET